jgi:hypothetical protein
MRCNDRPEGTHIYKINILQESGNYTAEVTLKIKKEKE